MNLIDFSILGGFPLTQDALEFMQTSTKEMLASWFIDVPPNQPVIISGMQVASAGAGGDNYENGYFYYNGEIYRHFLSYVPLPAFGQVVGVTINNTGTSVLFEDTTTHPVYFSRFATSAVYSTPLPAGVLDFSTFKLATDYIAARNMGATQLQIISGTNLTGSLNYRINHMTNQLHLWGTLTRSSAQTIQPYYENFFNIPVGFRPNAMAVFKGNFRYSLNYMMDSTNEYLIQDVNMELAANGDLSIGWIRPQAGVNSYSVTFNTLIQL